MASFASDNTAPMHPLVLESLVRANQGHATAYCNDEITQTLRARLQALLGRDDATIWPVFNGSACNGLALQAACKPYEAVLCHEFSHIFHDEAGLPEFYLGAKLIPLKGENGKISPDVCESYIQSVIGHAPHSAIPKVISLTQCTEMGTVYSATELKAFRALADRYGLYLHMDGARLFNALAHTGVNLRDMVADFDVVSFGGTKAGAMLAEAVIILNPALNEGFAFRHKRGGQLPSKARYISAQLLALLEQNLGLNLAKHANEMAQNLAMGLKAISGVHFLAPIEANAIFAHIPKGLADHLLAKGHRFYPWPQCGENVYRFVTSWATTEGDIDAFLRDANHG